MKWASLSRISGGGDPISVTDLKEFLNYEDDDKDSLISSLGASARSYAEQRTRRALLTQAWRGSFGVMPCNSEIWLPRPRIISVESVKYFDGDNDEQELASSNYHNVTGETGLVKILEWPSAHATRPDRYQINWTSGYGASGSDVPGDIIIAMKMLVNFWFEERIGDTRGATFAGKDVEIPTPIRVLLDQYKVPIERT